MATEVEEASATGGRGVLEGAFVVLDSLATLGRPAGLSELAREADLPKTTVYRLLDQLLAVGAVQRQGRTYVVGWAAARIGRAWRPSPALRLGAGGELRTLANVAACTTAISTLHQGRIVVAAAWGPGAAGGAVREGDEVSVGTAVGRVLLDGEPGEQVVLLEHEEQVPGVSCAAASVGLSELHERVAICAMFIGRAVPTGFADQVRRAAALISRNLSFLTPVR